MSQGTDEPKAAPQDVVKALTFKEWLERQVWINPGLSANFDVIAVFRDCWHARDAELANRDERITQLIEESVELQARIDEARKLISEWKKKEAKHGYGKACVDCADELLAVLDRKANG